MCRWSCLDAGEPAFPERPAATPGLPSGSAHSQGPQRGAAGAFRLLRVNTWKGEAPHGVNDRHRLRECANTPTVLLREGGGGVGLGLPWSTRPPVPTWEVVPTQDPGLASLPASCCHSRRHLPPASRLPSHLWCRALPLGLHHLQWVFDGQTHTPLQGLACIPGQLLPGLHQVARGGTTPRSLWAANPRVNPALCDRLLSQRWYLWSERVSVCVCVCRGGGGRARGVHSGAQWCCLQVQVKGTWRLSRGRQRRPFPGGRYLADGKILADGKSADTFRSRCKFKSHQPPALNIYTEYLDSISFLLFLMSPYNCSYYKVM